MTTTIRIPTSEVHKHRSDVLNYSVIHHEFRKAGIPTVGSLSFIGVEHGRLTMFKEHNNQGSYYVYQWEPDAQSVDRNEPGDDDL